MIFQSLVSFKIKICKYESICVNSYRGRLGKMNSLAEKNELVYACFGGVRGFEPMQAYESTA